jgi:hypothetical protein
MNSLQVNWTIVVEQRSEAETFDEKMEFLAGKVLRKVLQVRDIDALGSVE